MKSLYEHNWEKAVEGAKVNPSDALWDNIVSTLDKEQGRNYWVTILMIAATISIAFSFPLTIGDSATKVRLSETPAIAEQASTTKENQAEVAGKSEPLTLKKSIAKTAFPIQNQSNLNSTKNSTHASTEAVRPTNSNLASDIVLAEPKNTGLNGIQFGSTYQLTNISSYYFIPYFMPIKKDDNTGLLASLNLGTGNSSKSNGIINNSVESANGFAFSDMNNTSQSNIEKNESNSTAFYIGAGIELPLGKKWAILTGIGYLSNKAEGVNNVVADNGNGYQPLSVYDPFEVGSVFLNESYQYAVSNNYISVPISVKYPIINRKIKLRAGAGIGTDFMLSHIVSSETYGKTSYKPEEIAYKPVVLSTLINMEVNYSINNQYAIALESGIRRGITPIDATNQFYPSSFTVGLVLFYKIR